MTNQEKIQAVASGKAAWHNDGTKEQLEQLLKLTFPKDKTEIADFYNHFKLFYANKIAKECWTCCPVTTLPTFSVREYFIPDEKTNNFSRDEMKQAIVTTMVSGAVNNSNDIEELIDSVSSKIPDQNSTPEERLKYAEENYPEGTRYKYKERSDLGIRVSSGRFNIDSDGQIYDAKTRCSLVDFRYNTWAEIVSRPEVKEKYNTDNIPTSDQHHWSLISNEFKAELFKNNEIKESDEPKEEIEVEFEDNFLPCTLIHKHGNLCWVQKVGATVGGIVEEHRIRKVKSQSEKDREKIEEVFRRYNLGTSLMKGAQELIDYARNNK